jgi:WD40 repeat protein
MHNIASMSQAPHAAQAPISSLLFSPISAVMVSGSWDKAVRVWDIFEHKESTEPVSE